MHGPGTLPVVARKILILVTVVIVQVCIVENVCNFITRLGGNAVSRCVELVLRPGVYEVFVARVRHTVCLGVALGCQYVVERVVSAVAERQIIIALAENIRFSAVRIVACKEIFAYVYCIFLGFLGLQKVGFIVSDKIY